MSRRLRGAREDRAGAAGKVTVQKWRQNISLILGLESVSEGVTQARKVREHLREMKSVTPSPVSGPRASCQLRSSLRDQETGPHRGKRIGIDQIVQPDGSGQFHPTACPLVLGCGGREGSFMKEKGVCQRGGWIDVPFGSAE